MDRRLSEERLDRRYVLVPVMACMLLVVLGFGVTEFRRQQTRELNALARDRQEMLGVLSETINAALESESAQRGYLLTGETRYRVPFESSVGETRRGLEFLTERLQTLHPEALPAMQSVSENYTSKVKEMRESMALLEQGRNIAALNLVKSDAGQRYMTSIREQLGQLREQQREALYQEIAQASAMTRTNMGINAMMSGFTLVVLLIAGLFVSRDLRRRRVYSRDLRRRVAESTHQIRDLTRHMARITEDERHALARELHDELGGLLVSLRMDISHIRRRQPATDNSDLHMRWQRVEQALDAGIELKRRVIEELRPTLLDNMGLFTALRWQAERTCEQAGIEASLDIPAVDQPYPPDVAIAVFRTFQEALTNVAKHAAATHVRVTVVRASGRLGISIEDDGIGLPDDAEVRRESHGLKQMRFRIESLDGTFTISRRQPKGTIVEITLPDEAGSD